MNEDQNPADAVGNDGTDADGTYEAPTPGEAIEDQDGSDGAETGDAKEKPDATDGDKAPPAEDEKSRSAIRRERRQQHIAEIEERAARAEARVRELRAQYGDDPEPTEGEYTDYTEYAAARAVWKRDKVLSDRQTSQAQKQHAAAAAERHAEVTAQWREQVDAAKFKYRDFEKVALDQSVDISPAMGEVIRGSDHGADIAYHLGNNRAEASRIARMSPLQAARELGRIEANLSAPKARTSTNAPPPVRPVNPTSGTGHKALGDMTPTEYRRFREGK
jgi:hypothetical protein